MSDARVTTIETFVDAWNRQDLEAALSLVDDDFEFVNPPNAVEPGTRRGIEDLTMVLRKQWEALGTGGLVEIDRVHEREDHVITEARLSRGMPESSARVEVQALLRWAFEDYRLIRMQVLGTGPTYGDALAEAGVG
jgi:ketosteroid isomerase-like protein